MDWVPLKETYSAEVARLGPQREEQHMLTQHRIVLPPRRLSIAGVVILAMLTMAVGFGVNTAKIAKAAPTSPRCVSIAQHPLKKSSTQRSGAPQYCAGQTSDYYHSWYVVPNPHAVPMASFVDGLATSDANLANANCLSKYEFNLTILDFGSVAYDSSAGQYGVVDSQWPQGTILPDSTVAGLVEDYAKTWYNVSSNCPVLYLGIGTSNAGECDTGCGGGTNLSLVSAAGQSWDLIVHSVNQWIAGQGFSWQVIVEGADDIEGSWDDPSITDAFLSGYTSQEATYSTHSWLIDYGIADYYIGDYQGPQWAPGDVYYAAWGEGWDIPVPEPYWNLGNWGNVNNYCGASPKPPGYNCTSGPMQYYGSMTECTGSDPLPKGYNASTPINCAVHSTGSSYSCQYAPDQGIYEIGTQGQVDAAFAWETNIQFPNSTFNGSC